MAGCYYSLGPNAQQDLSNYVNDYYPAIFDGPIEPLIAAMKQTNAKTIRETVKRFEDIGCNEFLFQPINGEMHHLERLAEAVF
jgi:hypothetical protein